MERTLNGRSVFLNDTFTFPDHGCERPAVSAEREGYPGGLSATRAELEARVRDRSCVQGAKAGAVRSLGQTRPVRAA